MDDDTNTDEISSVQTTLGYLSALNSLFENGLLSHTPVKSSEDTFLTTMGTGMNFFIEWYNETIVTGNINHEVLN